jgi:putative ABC transport system permease protein
VPAPETWSRIEKASSRHPGLSMYDVAFLKQQADEVLDRSFLFANLQVTVAIFVGFLGILNTLFISVMRRKREIGLLRAVGMTGRQVSSMIVIESAFIAGLGGVAGVALGLASAAWPLAFHVRQISGYSMTLEVPWIRLLVALGAALVLGAVAGLIPARRAARMSVIEAIGYE